MLSLFMGSLADSFSSSSTGFFSQSPTTPRSSPHTFNDGAVGLGIVAAMNAGGYSSSGDTMQITWSPPPPPPPLSEPIPIVSTGIRVKKLAVAEEEQEVTESYTCVISHVGGKSVRKRVYGRGGESYSAVVFFELPPQPSPPSKAEEEEDFLSRCHLCRKKLHGFDIFMYRGERAFCSVECRWQQIANDGKNEGALRPMELFADSPASSPLQSSWLLASQQLNINDQKKQKEKELITRTYIKKGGGEI